MGPLVSLFLAYRIRRSLDHDSVSFAEWDKMLKGVLVVSGALAVLSPIFKQYFFVPILGYGLVSWFFWKVWNEKDFADSRPLMISLLPLVGAYFLNDAFEKIVPKIYEENNEYFGLLRAIGWVWFSATFFMQNRQEKAIKKEKEIRAIEQREYRINAARKAELEVLVNLRTAEITRQNQKLQDALDDLSAAQKQLIHAEKMASLGELTAGIAHEIQNPLNFVNNFSELNGELSDELLEALKNGGIKDAMDLAKDIKENQNKVVYHGKRADGIVKSMLQHSRITSNVKEITSLNILAEECIRLSFHGLRAKEKTFNAKMELKLDENLVDIEAVPGDLSRVLLNICTNAFYAVMKKSKLNLQGYQPEVKISTGNGEGMVWVKIEDNGEGISTENLEKIFLPFFTTKPTGEGTGLGLSMSYEIITKGHNGEIKVTSEEGEGTSFLIELPVNTVNKN